MITLKNCLRNQRINGRHIIMGHFSRQVWKVLLVSTRSKRCLLVLCLNVDAIPGVNFLHIWRRFTPLIVQGDSGPRGGGLGSEVWCQGRLSNWFLTDRTFWFY